MLFNNLGGLSGLECSVLVSDMMKSSLTAQVKYLAVPANVMTALDMPGFSISFLELTPELESALQSPTACPALPAFQFASEIKSIAAPVITQAERYAPVVGRSRAAHCRNHHPDLYRDGR